MTRGADEVRCVTCDHPGTEHEIGAGWCLVQGCTTPHPYRAVPTVEPPEIYTAEESGWGGVPGMDHIVTRYGGRDMEHDPSRWRRD